MTIIIILFFPIIYSIQFQNIHKLLFSIIIITIKLQIKLHIKLQRNEKIENAVGPCLNQEIADTWMVHLPTYLKDKISKELLPILEEWSNEKLEVEYIYIHIYIFIYHIILRKY